MVDHHISGDTCQPLITRWQAMPPLARPRLRVDGGRSTGSVLFLFHRTRITSGVSRRNPARSRRGKGPSLLSPTVGAADQRHESDGGTLIAGANQPGMTLSIHLSGSIASPTNGWNRPQTRRSALAARVNRRGGWRADLRGSRSEQRGCAENRPRRSGRGSPGFDPSFLEGWMRSIDASALFTSALYSRLERRR